MRIVSLDHNFENGTPARVHRPTGTVYLTPLFYEKYTPIQQRFIILHELGHYVGQTTDESEADRFAADIMLNLDGYKATFRALNDSLHGGGANDIRRINLFNYLKQRDMEGLDANAVINGGRELQNVSFESFEDHNGCVFTNDYIGVSPEIEDLEIADYLNYCDFYGVNYSDMGAKEFREAKRQAKVERMKARNDVRQSRADARRTRADAKMQKANAKMELAKKGISGGAKIGEALGSIGKSVAGIFGKKFGGGDADEAYAAGEVQEASEGKSKLPLIIGGVIVVIVVAVIIIVVVKKKKGK